MKKQNKARKRKATQKPLVHSFHHKWDTVAGTKVVTVFNNQGIIGVVSEVDHAVQLYRGLFNYTRSQGDVEIHNEVYVQKFRSMVEEFGYKDTNSPMVERAWSELPKDVTEAHWGLLGMVVVKELHQRTLDRLPFDASFDDRVLARFSRHPEVIKQRNLLNVA